MFKKTYLKSYHKIVSRMEINDIYIDSNVIDIIFKKLNYEDMIQFLQVNKYMATTYQNYIKYKIFDYINKDYRIFDNIKDYRIFDYINNLVRYYNYLVSTVFSWGRSKLISSGSNFWSEGLCTGHADT